MLRALFFTCALGASLAQAPVPAPSDARLASLQIKGNKRYSVDEVTRLSGLEIGRSVSLPDLATAANHLASTGLFDSVRYTYTTGNRQTSVTFEIVESAWTVPVVLDNFVWLADEQWISELRARVPSFDGTAPKTAGAPDFLTHALQQLLQARNLPGHVEFVPLTAVGSQDATFVFAVRDPSPKICELHVTRAAAIAEADLVAPLKSMIGTDYSRTLLASTARGTLTDMYRRNGFWRTTFADPAATVGRCDGVEVTLAVDEGSPYAWDAAAWSGNQALDAAVLDKAFGMKAGEVADVGKIDSGLRTVRTLYSEKGYIAEHAGYEPRLDDTSHRAVFAISISEGAQYHMGTVTVAGLRDADAAAVSKKWRLKAGDVYDETYEVKFLQEELARLRTTSGGGAKLNRDIDESAHVVNVKIVFN
jgi:outer membrane protein assembly factor BamA